MSYTIEVKEQPATHVLAVRTRTAVQNLPGVLGDCYRKIMLYLMELGQQPAGAPYVAYFNMDMNDLDIEAGYPVASTLPGREDMQPGEFPAGKTLSTLHTGPYDQMAAAYNEMNAWIQANHQQPTGTVYEFYLNNPAEVTPGELQTQIVMPLK